MSPKPSPTDDPFICALADLGIDPSNISQYELEQFARVIQDARLLGAGILIYVQSAPAGGKYNRLDPATAKMIVDNPEPPESGD